MVNEIMNLWMIQMNVALFDITKVIHHWILALDIIVETKVSYRKTKEVCIA